MKKILFLILILSIFILLFRFDNLFGSPKNNGFLKIESIPERATIFVNEREVGVTPWKSGEVEAGIHKVRLTTNSVDWEGKVEIAAGTETFMKRILGPTNNFSGGVIISYQKTKNGDNSARLTLTLKPENTKVFIDEKERETPVISNISVGEHKLKFTLDDYLTDEIEIEAKKGFLANIDVEMVISPFGEVKEKTMEGVITEGTEEKTEGTEGLEIHRRAEWSGGSLDVLENKLSLAPWQKIEVYPIVNANLNWRNNIDELIREMDFYAQEFLGLPSLPFAYLITEEGEVYEGLGVRNFDFSKISNQQNLKIENWKLEINSGVCPVVYLSTSSELTNKAEETLKKLQSYLVGPPQQSAKIITALEEITISPGETREVTLEFQNTGEVIWENTGDKRIFLVTTPLKRVSEFYNKNSWIAVDTISLLQEEKVVPGKIGKFTFSLTAPFYPIELSESLGLFIEETEKIVDGSEISLLISVGAEGLVTVEIKDTPTGFLNVRSSPSTYAELIGTVYPGEKYLFLQEEASWYKIKLRDGSEGWVYAKYVEKR